MKLSASFTSEEFFSSVKIIYIFFCFVFFSTNNSIIQFSFRIYFWSWTRFRTYLLLNDRFLHLLSREVVLFQPSSNVIEIVILFLKCNKKISDSFSYFVVSWIGTIYVRKNSIWNLKKNKENFLNWAGFETQVHIPEMSVQNSFNVST